MNSIMNRTTAQHPSAFGMPISGASYGACTAAATTVVVRERVAAAQGATGLARTDFPGTPAWRPPTC